MIPPLNKIKLVAQFAESQVDDPRSCNFTKVKRIFTIVVIELGKCDSIGQTNPCHSDLVSIRSPGNCSNDASLWVVSDLQRLTNNELRGVSNIDLGAILLKEGIVESIAWNIELYGVTDVGQEVVDVLEPIELERSLPDLVVGGVNYIIKSSDICEKIEGSRGAF